MKGYVNSVLRTESERQSNYNSSLMWKIKTPTSWMRWYLLAPWLAGPKSRQILPPLWHPCTSLQSPVQPAIMCHLDHSQPPGLPAPHTAVGSAATLIFPHLHPNTSPSYLMHFISISLLSMRIKSIKSLSEFFKSSIVGPMTRIVPKQFLCCDTTLSTWLVLSQGRRESRALWQAKNRHLFKQ